MKKCVMHPPNPGIGSNCIAWCLTDNGCFSVKIAYQASVCGNISNQSNYWSLIWKIQGPYQMRTFLWLVAHNRLLTNGDSFFFRDI